MAADPREDDVEDAKRIRACLLILRTDHQFLDSCIHSRTSSKHPRDPEKCPGQSEESGGPPEESAV